MTVSHGCAGSLKTAADLLGFIVITSATLYIAYKNAIYKGPSGTERNFNGYREENMLALFVNIFASVAYWARVISNAYCTAGLEFFTRIRYADYLATCPLLVLDLLWNLEGPYKCTAGGLILITILTGVACCSVPAPQSYLWFAFGDVIFIVTYVTLIVLVRDRLNYFVAHARNQRALKAMYYIKFACCCFFLIWIWYPMLWIVSPYCLNLIDIEVLDFLHMLLDVGAKSLYGIVLLWFRWNYDKKMLRNIEEEEYIEFSSRFPDRKAKMQIKIEEEESDSEGHEGGHKSGEHQQVKTTSSSGLIQPFIITAAADTSTKNGRPLPEHEGKGTYGTGSRLLFASNRRQSEHGNKAALILPSTLPRHTAEQLHNRANSHNHPETSPRDRWMSDLSLHLEEHGIVNPQQTLVRLEQGGVTEELLRTCITDEDLLEIGVDAAARRVILARYNGRGGGGGGGGWGQHSEQVHMPSMNDPAPIEMRAWSPRILS